MALKKKQKVLTPANKTLWDGDLLALQSPLVLPSHGVALLQPSSKADQAPSHFKAFAKALLSAEPLFSTLHLAIFKSFPQSPPLSLWAESGSFSSPGILFMSRFTFFINGFI